VNTCGLLARFEVVSGKDAEVEAFLQSAVPAIPAERGTAARFAIRFGRSEYGIFNVFPNDAARDTHLKGAMAAGLIQRSGLLFRQPPQISKLDVIAEKMPGASCGPGGNQGTAVDVQAKEGPRTGRRAVSQKR